MHLPAAELSAGLEASDMLSAADSAAALLDAVCDEDPARQDKDTCEGLLFPKPVLGRSVGDVVHLLILYMVW